MSYTGGTLLGYASDLTIRGMGLPSGKRYGLLRVVLGVDLVVAQRGVKKGASDYHPDAAGRGTSSRMARAAHSPYDRSIAPAKWAQHSAKFRSEWAVRKTRAETSALAVRASS